MTKRLSYLATPYSHKDHYMMVARFMAVSRYAAKIFSTEEGHFVFSPISHTHPIAEQGQLPRGWQFWDCYDRTMIGCCDDLIVLCLPGWEESTGVQAEIKIAEEFNIPVHYVAYDCNPTFQDMVAMALQMEVQMAPTLARASSVAVDGNASSPTTVCFTTDSEGVLRNTTDGTPFRSGLLHGV